MNPYLEKIYNQITADLAKMLFEIVNNYPGHEPEVCRLMTAQIGSYIAISAKDPQAALNFYATRLAHFDHATVRTDYFANTLGVRNTRPAGKPLADQPLADPTDQPLAEVHSIAARSSRNPVRTEPDAACETSGDPLAQKPE